MGKPKIEIDNKAYYKDIYFLYVVINALDNLEDTKMFLKDILTRSELRMFKKRWHIANLLRLGFDIRTVALMARTSTTTVAKLSRILDHGHGGLRIAIDKVNAKVKRAKEEYIKSKSPSGGSKHIKSWL